MLCSKPIKRDISANAIAMRSYALSQSSPIACMPLSGLHVLLASPPLLHSTAQHSSHTALTHSSLDVWLAINTHIELTVHTFNALPLHCYNSSDRVKERLKAHNSPTQPTQGIPYCETPIHAIHYRFHALDISAHKLFDSDAGPPKTELLLIWLQFNVV